jgi:tetratricopeptide (TPR) repeat protein
MRYTGAMNDPHPSHPAPELSNHEHLGLPRWLSKSLLIGQTVAYGVVPVLLIGALTWLVVTEMRRDNLEVAPIAVPARLAEAGLSPEVVANRLVDHIFSVEAAARAESVDRPNVELAGDMPDFSVPIAGLSLRSLATLMRTVLGSPPRRVSGEIVMEGDKIKLRLRLAGHRQVADIGGFGPDQVDALLAAAAPEIWRVISPRQYAWHVAHSERQEGRARDRLGRLLVNDPDPQTEQTLRMLIGRSWVRSSRPTEALEVLDPLVQAAPDYVLARYWRGRALRALQREDEALADLRRAQKLDPKALFISVGVSEILRDRGDLQAAMAEVKKVLAEDDDDPAGLVEQAQILLQLGRMKEALASVKTALLGDPYNPAAHRIVGRVLMAQGQFIEALDAFDEAMRHAPMAIDTHVRRAEALMALGRRQEAALELEEIAELGALPKRLEPAVKRLRDELGG